MNDIDKTRNSLIENLTNKNYAIAFNTINTFIDKICSNIQLLQDYSLRIGSKSDNKEKSEKT